MDSHTMAKLRFDRRLAGRRNWVAPDELNRELEKLPDVSDKIAPPEEPELGSGPPIAPGGETDTTAA